MTSIRFHKLVLDQGHDPGDVTRFSDTVFIRTSVQIPHANGELPVQLTQVICIDASTLEVTTNHVGWSGSVDAEQARVLAHLASAFAERLELVEKLAASSAQKVG